MWLPKKGEGEFLQTSIFVTVSGAIKSSLHVCVSMCRHSHPGRHAQRLVAGIGARSLIASPPAEPESRCFRTSNPLVPCDLWHPALTHRHTPLHLFFMLVLRIRNPCDAQQTLCPLGLSTASGLRILIHTYVWYNNRGTHLCVMACCLSGVKKNKT